MAGNGLGSLGQGDGTQVWPHRSILREMPYCCGDCDSYVESRVLEVRDYGGNQRRVVPFSNPPAGEDNISLSARCDDALNPVWPPLAEACVKAREGRQHSFPRRRDAPFRLVLPASEPAGDAYSGDARDQGGGGGLEPAAAVEGTGEAGAEGFEGLQFFGGGSPTVLEASTFEKGLAGGAV